LTISDVAALGVVVVDTPEISGDTTITNNAGDISLVVPTTGDVAIGDDVTGGTNSGTITITANTLGAVTFPALPAGVPYNTGDLTIAVPAVTGITGRVDIPFNAGIVNFDTTLIDTLPVSIGRNTGTINFTKNLVLGNVAQILRFPANIGDINFFGTLRTVNALGSTATAANNIAGSGTVVFGGLASFTDAFAINIDCNTVFNGGLTLDATLATTLAFGGDVTLGYGQTITFPAATPSALTLKAGKKLFVGTTPVLAAGKTNTSITPAANAVLTAGRARITDDDETFVGDRTLMLGSAGAATGITIASGDLRVLGGGILQNGIVPLVGPVVATSITTTGSLTLEDGAVLVLPAVGNTVVMGNTTIAGIGPRATPSQFIASGGAVTFAANSISGSGSTLAIPEEGGEPSITVGNAATPLVIAGASLDLQNGGSLNLGNAATSQVILEAGQTPGTLILGEDGDSEVTNLSGKNIAVNATLSGNGILNGSAETSPSTVGYISGVRAGRLTISGTGTATVIKAGVSVTW
jgi:hypothetical protein